MKKPFEVAPVLAVIVLLVVTACAGPVAAARSTTSAPAALVVPAGLAVSAAPQALSADAGNLQARPGVASKSASAKGNGSAGADDKQSGVEPNAGSWKTFLLTSGSQFRPPAPPDKQATRDEIEQLLTYASQRDAAALQQVAYWDNGGPIYRWQQIALDEVLKRNMNTNMAERALALLDAAAYDAIIATWDAKYTFKRARPSDFDHRLTTAIANPDSPTYPSEYAAVASASSGVLGYLFPDKAQAFSDLALAAGKSRLLAGVEYPSDVEAGKVLGAQVAALAIERGKTDNTDAKWTGTVPTEPGHWTGTNPVLPMFGTAKTWVLSSGSEFRPGPPPAYNSPEMAAELAQVTGFQRTPKQTADSFFWEYGAGGLRSYSFWNQELARLVLAHDLAANPPRAARSYVLTNIAAYDAAVACWDAKYTYWAPRPFQLDPNFKPLFTTPNHPSYPSAHSCISTAVGATLAYLFGADAQAVQALADNASQSRIWAGIHFPSDVTAGQTLGQAVAQKTILQAQADGSQ